MKLSLLIIDDEDQARRLLNNLVRDRYNDAHIFEAANLLEGVKIIKENPIDIVLSDINMPIHNGLEIVNFFDPGELNATIIFVTAYDHYAIEAFKTNAVDYILKPVDEDELYQAIDKALRKVKKDDQVINSIKRAVDKLAINKISIEVPKGYMFVSPDEIIMFEADSMYTHVHLTSGKKELISKPLKYFVDQLKDNFLFYRPQRSFLINLKHIKEVRKDEALFIIMENDKAITVSRDRKKSFIEMLQTVF
jgi:two-component system LytT family response regulator